LIDWLLQLFENVCVITGHVPAINLSSLPVALFDNGFMPAVLIRARKSGSDLTPWSDHFDPPAVPDEDRCWFPEMDFFMSNNASILPRAVT